jgi:hypothetical protein
MATRQYRVALILAMLTTVLGCSRRTVPPFEICTYDWQTHDIGKRNGFALSPSADSPSSLTVGCFTTTNSLTQDDLYRLSFVATPTNVPRLAVVCGDFSGYMTTYTNEGLHWDAWWLASSNLHLFITYNSPLSSNTNELETVRKILGTLKRRKGVPTNIRVVSPQRDSP